MVRTAIVMIRKSEEDNDWLTTWLTGNLRGKETIARLQRCHENKRTATKINIVFSKTSFLKLIKTLLMTGDRTGLKPRTSWSYVDRLLLLDGRSFKCNQKKMIFLVLYARMNPQTSFISSWLSLSVSGLTGRATSLSPETIRKLQGYLTPHDGFIITKFHIQI